MRAHSGASAFTLMEILVVVAIILVLAAIAFPVFGSIQMRANKAVAIRNMQQLAAAAADFASQNDGTLPEEDAKGPDTWQAAALPESGKAWYNCLPRMLGSKGVGDYASIPRDYYTKQNLLFMPGAQYPETDRKLAKPLFAISMNTKLQRKNEDDQKAPLKMSMITHPSRTILFLEQGLPGEKKGASVQSKKDYDGSPKGSAKSMAGRYGGSGVLVFADGHAEVVEVKNVLTETGRFPFPQTDFVWTRTPDEDPNK
jgi:prepilin-type N-terminal cleavage/methylation domain-containing protein/prepilin-type processing-associated H-X9-DG protein